MPAPEEMSRDELIVVVHRLTEQITVRDQQISAQARQLAELREANEALGAKLARLEYLLLRNSGNSSSPPSKDDDPGKPAPPERQRGRGGPARSRGKQPGAPGSHLAWTERPDERGDRFPRGSCGCGADLDTAQDLGVIDRYQSHEIPRVKVKVIQYNQHQVRCGCGRVHTATRPEGARPGQAGNLLEILRDRPADVLRFAHDLKVPPTSNQAERDLRPAKVQQNTSGRLTSEERSRDRYTIRGYLSTAIKHGHDALTGKPWIPALPAPT